jgi:hypothetical protein
MMVKPAAIIPNVAASRRMRPIPSREWKSNHEKISSETLE